ncbi:S-4TM family putative pore-forming effector [Neobacillus pocheonensis]|uniref:S-4TM family putative pore-forming effector n=1 Tax=Neobacillus pocheonensis TaxID=363869 RepID=UPI003D26CF57
MEEVWVDILRQTRNRENIKLLMARDFSYHQARKLNWVTIFLAVIPIIYSIISKLTGFKLSEYTHLDKFINEKMIGVILSIIVYLMTLAISEKIKRLKEFSNRLREQYDCNVFNLPLNKYMMKIPSHQEIDKYSEKQKELELYSVWYGEKFTSNHLLNIVVCQADNISYAAFLYKKLNNLLFIFSSILIMMLIVIVFTLNNFEKVFFNVLVPSFTIFTIIFKVTYKSTTIQKEYQHLLNLIKEDAFAENIDLMNLRMLQDKIFQTRSNDIITPKMIREKLLGENNEYKTFFYSFRENIYKGVVKQIKYPSEIPVYDLNYHDSYTIDEIHQPLLIMLKELDKICSENGLRYIIDGGTLLGSIRNQGFIPWDDDIDIGIKYEDREKFYSIVKKHLSSDYSIQCFGEDPFYSPVLPKFRIRLNNTEVIEKLPNASSNFKHKGIFIDVYSFDFALKGFWMDKLYRLLIMLPIYQILTHLDTFGKGKYKLYYLKKLYLFFEWVYSKLPKNKEWMSYSPSYLYKLLRPGPYYQSDKVFNDLTYLPFEDSHFQGPADAHHILQRCYGDEYMLPNKIYVTVLQHIKAIKL